MMIVSWTHLFVSTNGIVDTQDQNPQVMVPRKRLVPTVFTEGD
jgi:hypothetical protein